VKKVDWGLGTAVNPQLLQSGTTEELAAAWDAVFEKAMFPIRYTCRSCKKRFEALPVLATPDDLLPIPCTVYFTRESTFKGSAAKQSVYSNGIGLLPMGNGQTISFKTPLRHNTLFVTDQQNLGYEGICYFEPQPGEEVRFSFKNGFTQTPTSILVRPSTYSAYAAYAGQAATMEATIGDEWVDKNKQSRFRGRIVAVIIAVVLILVMLPAYLFMSQCRGSHTYVPPQSPVLTAPR
jgi:hypothetical protein